MKTLEKVLVVYDEMFCDELSIKLLYQNKDLINEFERKKINTFITFEEFLVTKFVSLVPAIYKNLLKILSTLSHPVSAEFLTKYKLGNVAYLEYLLSNF